MCIAILKPKNKIISKETLEQCFKSNSDGAGFMYASNKKLHVQKGFFTFKEFYEAYKEHEDKQVVLHFRIKTHGPVQADNCHPFKVNDSLAFVHNGIINGFGSTDKSDTREFNSHILQPLVDKWGNLAIFQPAIKNLVENRIGYSKLIFLDRHGNTNIFNEDKGVWDNDIWYSNTSYKIIPPAVVNYPRGFSATKQQPTVKYIPKVPSKVEIGEIVELTRAHYDAELRRVFHKGDIFEIIAVNQDFTADLMSDTKNTFLYNVPFSKIEFWKAAESDSYNYYKDDYYSYKGI